MNVKSAQPNKKFYSLESDFSKIEKLTTAKFPKLRIQKFRILSNYEGKEFVYKKDLEYENDFYNQFLVPPSTNITDQFIAWVNDANIAKIVTNRLTIAESNFIIEGNVMSLYIDFSKGKMQAVLDIELYLTETSKDTLLLKKLYSRRIDLKEKTVDVYVNSWNTALTEIFMQFTKDIQKLEIPVP